MPTGLCTSKTSSITSPQAVATSRTRHSAPEASAPLTEMTGICSGLVTVVPPFATTPRITLWKTTQRSPQPTTALSKQPQISPLQATTLTVPAWCTPPGAASAPKPMRSPYAVPAASSTTTALYRHRPSHPSTSASTNSVAISPLASSASLCFPRCGAAIATRALKIGTAISRLSTRVPRCRFARRERRIVLCIALG